MHILDNLKKIKAFVLDVDGVLTDGTLLVLEDGQMARKMHIRDGYALQLAVKKGYQVIVISGSNSEAVKKRLQKLGVESVFMNVLDKADLLHKEMHRGGLTAEMVLYMGDDIPDIPAMKIAGLACCPADACQEVLALSHYVSIAKGGKGCVRDVIEKVLKLNNEWSDEYNTPSA